MAEWKCGWTLGKRGPCRPWGWGRVCGQISRRRQRLTAAHLAPWAVVFLPQEPGRCLPRAPQPQMAPAPLGMSERDAAKCPAEASCPLPGGQDGWGQEDSG